MPRVCVYKPTYCRCNTRDARISVNGNSLSQQRILLTTQVVRLINGRRCSRLERAAVILTSLELFLSRDDDGQLERATIVPLDLCSLLPRRHNLKRLLL